MHWLYSAGLQVAGPCLFGGERGQRRPPCSDAVPVVRGRVVHTLDLFADFLLWVLQTV